ncbi:S9 family peptidase [Psychrobium sp. 1_MG-2023]|uniref:S9 family peptidase n=1 Tax=Psychrobium sp. 1_MG-2023 TaxID=3062624 RepID=UPI000C32B9B8|nr:S9 family peptidase [Psychrobium sp. 1_MG-2023]MDP2562625.1 S9 family peptidase [Psychrobium sp. 1_MG-2023]PKF54381.1 S9 family peptidase [Alteromonadales bacterium alter-6D02]
MINKKLLLLSIASLGLASPAWADEINSKNINVLGPIVTPQVTLIGDKEKAETPFTKELSAALAAKVSQQTQSSVSVFGQKLTWKTLSDGTDAGHFALNLNLKTERFTTGTLALSGLSDVRAFINGQVVNASDDKVELSLKNGDHQLLILTSISDSDDVKIEWKGAKKHDLISFYDASERRVYPEQLFDSETVSQVSLSPDGKQYIWTKNHYDPSLGDKANRAIRVMELRDAKTNQLLQRWSASLPSSLQWSPNNKQLAYVEGGKVSLLSRDTRQVTALTAALSGVSGLRWLDDNRLIFSWSKKAPAGNKITKRYQALEDRWGGWRNNSQVYLLDIASGAIAQLTDGASSTQLLDSRGDRILVSRYIVDYKEPAHNLTEVSELNLTTNELTQVGEYRTFNGAKYASDGIYILAGPSFNNGLGEAVSEGVVANNYDTQLYFRDQDGDFTALSKEFDPSIGQISVLPNDDIVLRVTEKDGSSLFHFDAEQEQFSKVNTGMEVVESFSVSDFVQPTILFKGTSATQPQQVALQSIHASHRETLFDSEKESYADTKLGAFEQWDFTNSRGETIEGRYYLPPQFDANNDYPALVYYYGGTSPVSRAFTGRYPFNLWAAQGYVVYVIQPTGATGFGQDFSGKHVNAWGKYTAEDIIEGTREFAKAHSFVDSTKIGNLGASYGGFMTMQLATKTDVFAASMSHAGISNLSNYWGYGWWGYLYSGVASKGSFPWNNKSLYVENSPLYNADKVNHPMLLIHGDSDTNVPVSESHSMYTALKLLGKDVELVEFKGLDHTINSRKERLVWWDTTLAFFDMHLKDQPQWWNKLYPSK